VAEDVEAAFGDPLTTQLWEAARRGELLLQRCGACGHHQHYPRPMCLSCDSVDLAWVVAGGGGEVYAQSRVHVPVHPTLERPYVIALVTLDEGPRITTNLVGGTVSTGGRVRLQWLARPDGLPPIPVFGPDPA